MKNYQEEDEPAPEYKMLPDRIKAMVIDQPLHLKIQSAEDISKQLKENDDPETAVEQHIQIVTPDSSKLFMNQPICIIQGQGRAWTGYIEHPHQPLSTAWIYVYQFEPNSKLDIAKQGDVISTSNQECGALN